MLELLSRPETKTPQVAPACDSDLAGTEIPWVTVNTTHVLACYTQDMESGKKAPTDSTWVGKGAHGACSKHTARCSFTALFTICVAKTFHTPRQSYEYNGDIHECSQAGLPASLLHCTWRTTFGTDIWLYLGNVFLDLSNGFISFFVSLGGFGRQNNRNHFTYCGVP